MKTFPDTTKDHAQQCEIMKRAANRREARNADRKRAMEIAASKARHPSSK